MRLLSGLRTFLTLVACGAVAFVASADGRQGATRTTPEQEDEPVRIRTDLVQTHVMVFDKQGRFVEGLGREQFELSVDGKPQPISFFEQVRAGSRGEERLLNAARGVTAGSPADEALPSPTRRGRTITFFIDDLHLSLSSLEQTRQMLSRFIERDMGQDDLVAIASTSGQIGFLQQFTDNRSVLRAAASRLIYKPYNVRDMAREGTPMTEYMALAVERKDDPDVFAFYVDECMKYAPPKYQRRACEVEVINRARLILLQAASVISNTYDSLESLMLSAAQLPGRKLVFFISDGFLLDTGPRNADPRGKLNEITDAAQRAGVVIYTIDARGLVSGQLDSTNNIPFDPKGRLENTALREIPASQDALNALAADTGGRALRNQNVFEPWVNKILEETSNYYLLAWRPNDEGQARREFHNIKVSVVGRPELTVRLPRGVLGASPAAAATSGKTKPQGEAAKSPPQALSEALHAVYPRRGVPTALSVTYLDTPGHGLVLTASMQVSDAGLTFEAAGGRQTATVDAAGVVLNDKGKQAGQFQTRLNINTQPSGAPSARRSGTVYNYRVPLAPGIYQVRVAARDSKSGYVGGATQWIEIPDLTSGRLNLSSLLLGVPEAEGSDAKAGAEPQAQFSVDNHFARSSRLRLMCFLYNAARGASGGAGPDVTVQARVLRDGQSTFAAPLGRMTVQERDAARILYGGEIPLNNLPAGNYVLQVTATDHIAGTSAVQQANITVE